jgi:hypothetical protein
MFDNKKKKFDQALKEIGGDNLHSLQQKCDLSAKPVYQIPPFVKKIDLPRARIMEMQNYAKMLRNRNPSISQAKLTEKVSKKFHITLTDI